MAQGSRSEAAAPAIAVVGASAGGVEALCAFVRGLPAELDHAVLAVLHLAPYGPSVLDKILARHTTLPVARPSDGDPLLAGHIYVAPPDRHLLVGDGALHLSAAPKENGHRPAIDATLRSAVRAFGPATAGVLLSGSGDDGTAGLIAVHRAGGATAVQDPEEALYDRMARAAMHHLDVDAVLPAAEIGTWIAQRPPAGVPVPANAMSPNPPGSRRSARAGDSSAPGHGPATAVPDASGAATRFTCPDCGGVLFASENGGLLQFSCSVGHKYSSDTLVAANVDAVEAALWTAVRMLEDRIVLLSRMADRARSAGLSRSAASMESQERVLLDHAATIRGALAGLPGAEVS